MQPILMVLSLYKGRARIFRRSWVPSQSVSVEMRLPLRWQAGPGALEILRRGRGFLRGPQRLAQVSWLDPSGGEGERELLVDVVAIHRRMLTPHCAFWDNLNDVSAELVC